MTTLTATGGAVHPDRASLPPSPLPGHDPALDPIAAKVRAGERLSLEDGRVLFATPDIWTVCGLADGVRRRLHGDVTYYNINRHLNYSNVCALSCTFCEFYRKRGDEGAYEHSIADVRAEARGAIESGATEMHIVGGLHPYLPFAYYTELVSAIREEAEALGSQLHIKAFTAVEIVHLAKIAKVYKRSDRTAGIRWVLERLKEAGLGSLPGGGAEVFDDRVHDEAFKGKIRSDVWLDVHRVAHELGLNTNATMLYGHIESLDDRLVHMDMLRRAQDEALLRLGYEPAADGAVTLTREGVAQPTPDLAPGGGDRSPRGGDRSPRGGYFQTITPLPFFPDGSELEHLPGPGGLENLRTLAVSRLMLDNFPHVKAFWIMQTLGMAQLMLQSGADDLDGTVVWYDITKVGGSDTHQETTVRDLERAIREAGQRPVERDTLYRRVERDGATWWLAGNNTSRHD
ncbi:MAG: radical SAM protein [Planctomycetota bacterium]|nr:radical SAM protein [Planctomycetota bacterium]